MKSLILVAAILALGAAPALAQTRVQVSIGVGGPSVHGRLVLVSGHRHVRHPRVVVIERSRHHHRARRGLVLVARTAPPRGHAHGHAHFRHHRLPY